ncbi:hypothetical protein DRQ07_05555 [candidate division KSB1 bacterium]|nr:MAG: hypothetical protein DRQ07_05555 [candidate division KSB1 bacterium]
MVTVCRVCKKEFNADLSECPFCGAEREDDQVSNPVPLCPHCRTELKKAEIRDTVMHICSKCNGIWLGSDDFAYLVSKRSVYKDDKIPKKYERKPLKNNIETKMYVPCPVCNQLMNRQNFKKISGVIIDICRKHGVWLDAGELEQIRSFVANVDYEEELARHIELNSAEIGSLQRQLNDVKLVQLATNFWNLKYWFYK